METEDRKRLKQKLHSTKNELEQKEIRKQYVEVNKNIKNEARNDKKLDNNRTRHRLFRNNRGGHQKIY